MDRAGVDSRGGVRSVTSLEFSELARRLCDAARAQGYEGPLFRSPPRNPGCDRSISRKSDGTTRVAVRLKQRPIMAVAADMIDGVLATNGVDGRAAGELRDLLWTVAEDLLMVAEAPSALVTHMRAA